jgi:hypothetical protein
LLMLFLFSHELMLTLCKTNMHMCFYIDFVHIYNIMRQGRPLFNIMNLSGNNFPSNICAQPNSLLYSFFFYSSSKYLLSNVAISTLGFLYSTCHISKDTTTL